MTVGSKLPPPATVHWDTGAVAEPVRLEYWVDAVCQTYCQAACDAPEPVHFNGSLTVVQTGGITISHSLASPRRGWSLAEKQSLFLITNLRGYWTIQQGAVVNQLRPGDVAIVDGTTRWCFEFPQASRLAVIELPVPLASRWLPAVHSAAPRIAHRERGWSRVLSATCAELAGDLQLASAVTPAFVESNIGGLLAACLTTTKENIPPTGDLVQRAISLMEQRLQEPGLSIASISDQLGTSTRTLHRAFAQRHDTAGACLRRLRIGHACELLANPRMQHVRIEEIARRSGFVSASHFAREFRQECGTSPLQWRTSRHAAATSEIRRMQIEDCDRRIALAEARVEELRRQLKSASLHARVFENATQLLAESEKYLAQLHRIRSLYANRR